VNDMFRQAAEALRREGVRMKGLVAAAEALEKIGSLEQLASEADGRRAEAQAKATEAVRDLGIIEDKISQTSERVKEVEKSAKEFSDSVMEKARIEVKSLIAAATQQAENILSQARGLEMAVADSIQQKRKTVEVLNKEIQEKSDVLTALKKEMVALRGKLG
jgi:chromosome segregation ATPase